MRDHSRKANRHKHAQWANPGDPGTRFIQSAGWKSVQDPASRAQNWTTGPVDIGPLEYKTGGVALEFKTGTAFEGGQGAGLIPTPQVIPGMVTTLFQPNNVAPLFAQGVATTNSVRYIIEGTATNSAAGVAEGGTKPTSDLALSTTDEPVKKIATVIGPVSDELFEDVSGVQAYMGGRLQLFVRAEQDRQLLRGRRH